jgi:hypothetical protein
MLGVKIDDSPTTLKAVTAAIIENAHMHRSDTLAWFGGHGLQQLKRTAAPAEPHVETAQFPRAYVSGVVPSDKLSDNADKTPYEATVMDGLPDLFARHEGAAKDATKETAKTAAKTRAAVAKAAAGDEAAQGGPEAGVQVAAVGQVAIVEAGAADGDSDFDLSAVLLDDELDADELDLEELRESLQVTAEVETLNLAMGLAAHADSLAMEIDASDDIATATGSDTAEAAEAVAIDCEATVVSQSQFQERLATEVSRQQRAPEPGCKYRGIGTDGTSTMLSQC